VALHYTYDRAWFDSLKISLKLLKASQLYKPSAPLMIKVFPLTELRALQSVQGSQPPCMVLLGLSRPRRIREILLMKLDLLVESSLSPISKPSEASTGD
jgi:hypothetical protein